MSRRGIEGESTDGEIAPIKVATRVSHMTMRQVVNMIGLCARGTMFDCLRLMIVRGQGRESGLFLNADFICQVVWELES